MQNTSELWSPQVALEWIFAPSAKLKILGKRPTCGPLKAFRLPMMKARNELGFALDYKVTSNCAPLDFVTPPAQQ